MSKRNAWLILSLGILILLSFADCKDDSPSDTDSSVSEDATAPQAVADLRVQSIVGGLVTLAWTAPGDDGDSGTASVYDIRYSSSAVTEGTWAGCTQASTEPDPAAAGTEQYAIIDTGGGMTFYFALKTSDEVPNWSGLSNVVVAPMQGTFVVHQLTSDGTNNHPCVDDGYVTWVRYTYEDGYEIYIANLENASPTPTGLTDNDSEKRHPNNHGSERIVWQQRETSIADWEIWIYDKYAAIRYSQFTDNEVDDTYPDLSSAGSFAWLQGHILHESVHYWNEYGHSESVLSNDCCPTSEWYCHYLSADASGVVWRAYDRVDSGGPRAYLWNGTLTDITDIIDANLTTRYILYEGTLAYQYGTDDPPMIAYWDGDTVHDVGRGYEPSLYDGTVAFLVYDGDWEIRYWDGMIVQEITDNDFDDFDLSLHGSFIVWEGRPGGGPGQIFYVDVTE